MKVVKLAMPSAKKKISSASSQELFIFSDVDPSYPYTREMRIRGFLAAILIELLNLGRSAIPALFFHFERELMVSHAEMESQAAYRAAWSMLNLGNLYLFGFLSVAVPLTVFEIVGNNPKLGAWI